ncbi:NUDIX hydrolase [Candidatus Uhrbacteria bacterium]|nr:NUDIX hydrolase [Candidatus Uhrbacteria bacterium]
MFYLYCPRCGSAYAEQTSDEAFFCSACNFALFRNSKPTASILLIHNGKVLLGKRGHEPQKGVWDVIGGFLNLGEHPEDGAKREAREETGYDIEIESLLGMFMDTYDYERTGDVTLNICYIASISAGEPKPGDDIAELGWFNSNELPQPIAFKNGQDMLDAWVKKIQASKK